MKELAEEHHVATVYASLELSQSTWLVTSLSPGSVTMSKHSIAAGDSPGLLGLLARLRTKAERAAGVPVEIVVIQEAGLDGFWVHRLLEANRIESHVVDAASIAVPRRRRRAKTDAIDDVPNPLAQRNGTFARDAALVFLFRGWRRNDCADARLSAFPSQQRPQQGLALRHSAISSLRASATMAIRRTRPVSAPTRSRNRRASALSGWCLTHNQASSTMMWRRRGLPALEMPCSRSIVPLRQGVGANPA
jgi:hypothetical protein